MRFEIRAGGFFIIVLGLLGLSTIVFVSGVLVGNEVAKQNTPDASQLSSTFPLPSPPALDSTPAPIAVNTPAPAPIAPIARVAPRTAAPVHTRARLFTPVPLPSVAAVVPAAPLPEPRAPSTRAFASASNPSSPAMSASRRPYNIQIEAVMDRDGASRMVSRLRALGYPASTEETQIDGAPWYRVRVGPYDSAQAAETAQARLRAQYKATYGTH